MIERAKPLTKAGQVVNQGQVEALGFGKAGRELLDVFQKNVYRDGAGANVTVAQLGCSAQAASTCPPNQIGGCGFCTGFGSIGTDSRCENRPSSVVLSSVH